MNLTTTRRYMKELLKLCNSRKIESLKDYQKYKNYNIIISLPILIYTSMSCIASAIILNKPPIKDADLFHDIDIINLLLSSILTIITGFREIMKFNEKAAKSQKSIILLDRLSRSIKKDLFNIDTSLILTNEVIEHMLEKVHNDLDLCLGDESTVSYETVRKECEKESDINIYNREYSPSNNERKVSIVNEI